MALVLGTFTEYVLCNRDYGLQFQTKKEEGTIIYITKLFMRFSLALLPGVCLFTVVLFASLPVSAITINEFPVPPANSSPARVTAGADSNLWFAETAGNKIGQVTQNDPTVVSTMTEWGMVIMNVLCGGSSIYLFRRRRAV
jgi:hypothetical protein